MQFLPVNYILEFYGNFLRGEKRVALREEQKVIIDHGDISREGFGVAIYSVLNISRSFLRSAMRHEFSSRRSLFQTCAVRTSQNNVRPLPYIIAITLLP